MLKTSRGERNQPLSNEQKRIIREKDTSVFERWGYAVS